MLTLFHNCVALLILLHYYLHMANNNIPIYQPQHNNIKLVNPKSGFTETLIHGSGKVVGTPQVANNEVIVTTADGQIKRYSRERGTYLGNVY